MNEQLEKEYDITLTSRDVGACGVLDVLSAEL